MTSIPLKFPIPAEGAEGTVIASVTLRRPKAKDMVAIGDHISAIASLDPDNPQAGMSAATFKAMVVIVGTLTGIGEQAAGELDFEDLVAIAGEASGVLGEATGSDGEDRSGA